MSIAQIAALLVETGELDIVCTPIDLGGNMGQVSCYNGDYGSVSGASFQYATGRAGQLVQHLTLLRS